MHFLRRPGNYSLAGPGPMWSMQQISPLLSLTAGNLIFKYADDTYLVTPAFSANCRSA